MNTDGSAPVRLTLNSHAYASRGYAPAWSPDGTKIALTAWCPTSFGADFNIYVLRVDGTNSGPAGPDPGDNFRVNGVRFMEVQASGDAYRLGEQIRVAVTRTEAVTVTGTPQ